MTRTGRLLSWTVGAVLILLVVAALSLSWLWRYRAPLEALPWPIVETLPDNEGSVTVTWLGITTLLFDDGETQILVDGTFTRLSPLDIALALPVSSDIATINYVMDEYRIDRLAAIVPVHSHFDHAIDVGRVANRSTALVLGTESIANIARGAGVPVDQSQILASGEKRVFGDFTITLLESRHVPVGIAEQGWPAGVIDEPLEQPARFWDWRGGAAVSVMISHPAGTALVHGSAGFLERMLENREADVVFLSVAGLAAQGPEYTERYWEETVRATGASEVYAIHFDDFTREFGDVQLFPDIVDEVVVAADWINAAAAEDGIVVRRPPFGIPVTIF
jgi:L-ascorbate metabolism protein UlaG (beta-lactamase superfamily)